VTHRVLTFFLLALLAGCKVQYPPARDRGAEVDDIARLFVALRMESRSWEGQPERARAAREKLLKDAGFTLPEWRERVRKLQSDPDLWTPFWERSKQIADSIETRTKTTPKGS
jgi:hypothetical protein